MNSYDKFVDEQISTLRKINYKQIAEFALAMSNVFSKNGTVWLAGNGGSATSAAHMATDLSKGVFLNTGKRSRAICLNEHLGTTTAWVNDFKSEDFLANYLNSVASTNDAVCVISGSGNSTNVIKFAEISKYEIKIPVFSLTGIGGGKLLNISDFNLDVKSNDMQIVENTHIYLIHCIYKELSGHFDAHA